MQKNWTQTIHQTHARFWLPNDLRGDLSSILEDVGGHHGVDRDVDAEVQS